MNKKYLLLLLSVAYCSFLSAQKTPSTLLWKISGRGLQKPSYLYGTMHLTDERVFDIGDSVYKAIENSDGFATEIDPEELTPFIIDETKKSYIKAEKLKDMMSHDEYKKYGKILAKKLNKNEDDITTADILREKNKWIHESYSTGKMQTFLDVYLFDIARRQGKWTGGVEDLSDQEDILDLVDESDIKEIAADGDEEKDKEFTRSLESFIKVYTEANLDAIDSLSYTGDSSYENNVLIKRNKKMAMRMDSLGHERSMVFAVGAAHLPGDEGLIALLRERGFTVTPVFSSKKIKPQNYKVAEVNLPWVEVKDEAGFYSVSMPGKPGDLNLYGILNMKMYFDVFKSTLYMATAMKTPYSQKMADSVFDELAAYYFNAHSYASGKPITLNTVPGREFSSTKETYSHGYLLYKDGVMYIVVAMCMKKDTSVASSINKFLHSFTIYQQTQSSNQSCYSYTNKIKAYSVELPAQPKPMGDMLSVSEDSTISREIYAANDPVNGSYFFFGTNEAAKRFFIENDSATLAQLRKSQHEKFNSLDLDTLYIKNGHRVMEFEGTMVQAPLTMKVHYEFRGNRWYALVAMFDPAKSNTSVDRFFNSFTLLGYVNSEWSNYTAHDNLFTTWAPQNFTFLEKPSASAGNLIADYEAYDSTRADTYAVVATPVGKYFWVNSDSALWETLIKQATDYNDSVLLKRIVNNGDVKGCEMEIQQQGSNNIKRKRMLLNGDKIYTLLTIQASSEINNANNNKFFESFRFNTVQSESKVFSSKATVLLKDIASDDSATRNEALDYLKDAPFSKSDLPLLHNALLKNYVTDEDDNYDQTKNNLKQIIIDLDDTSSYSFAKNNYVSADDETKNILLAIMSSFPSQDHFADIKNFLLHQPPGITPDDDLTDRLTDTLQLTAAMFPELLPLLKDTVMSPVIIQLVNKLLDSALIDKALLQPYFQDIIQLWQKKYNAAKQDPDNYDELNHTLIALLGKLNNIESNAMLQQWSKIKGNYLQIDAVEMLLRNKQAIDPSVIKILAADNDTRIELYDSLLEYKKEALFPAQYHTQKYFAESNVYIVASDDDDPTELTYLTQKVINFKGRQSRFFFYKVTYGEGDDASYSLACAGPFHMNASDVSSKDASGDIYYDEDFDPSNLSAQMDALIKQMEDWYTWPDEKEKKE